MSSVNGIELAPSCFNCIKREECKPCATLSQLILTKCEEYVDNPKKYYNEN